VFLTPLCLPQTDIAITADVFFLKFRRRIGDPFSSGHGAEMKKWN